MPPTLGAVQLKLTFVQFLLVSEGIVLFSSNIPSTIKSTMISVSSLEPRLHTVAFTVMLLLTSTSSGILKLVTAMSWPGGITVKFMGISTGFSSGSLFFIIILALYVPSSRYVAFTHTDTFV